MTNNLQSDFGKNNNFAAVMKLNTENIMRNLHVANLCMVKEILTPFNGTYGEARLDKLCLNKNEIGHSIVGYFFYDTPSIGDIVLNVITDCDFRNVITQDPIKPMQIEQKMRHSEGFGIILKLN